MSPLLTKEDLMGDIHAELRERHDKCQRGFPGTDSAVEMEILQ